MDIQLLALSFFDYSNYILGYSPRTIKRYKHSIAFFCHSARVQTIEEVTLDNVRDFFYHGRSQRGWQTRTFHSYHKSLMVFFRWCVKNKHMETNPLEDVEIPKLERRIPPKLTKQETFKLLEYVYNYPYAYRFERFRNQALFAVFIYAGLRKSEALNLRFTDVDLDNLTLFIKQGKGNKDRLVPISYTLAQILKQYLQERKRLNKTCPLFFTSMNRNTGFTDTGIKRVVERMRKASKISFTIHKLRHTFATLMLEGGCDLFSLSKMMGHNDIKTTTIYLNATVEHLKGQMSKHPLN